MSAPTAPASLADLLDHPSVDGGDPENTVRVVVNLDSWSWDDPDTDRAMEDLVREATEAGWFGRHSVSLVLAPPHDGDGPCYAIVTVAVAGAFGLELVAHAGMLDQLLGPSDTGGWRTGEQLAQALLDGVTGHVEIVLDRARQAGLKV